MPTCDIFFSLRFNAKGPKYEATLLRQELQEYGINVEIVDAGNNENIPEIVFNKLAESKLVVIFGTEDYGEKGVSICGTDRELAYIIAKEKKTFFIKMGNTFRSETTFGHLHDKMYDMWRIGQPMPPDLVSSIIEKYESVGGIVSRKLSSVQAPSNQIFICYSAETQQGSATQIKKTLDKKGIFTVFASDTEVVDREVTRISIQKSFVFIALIDAAFTQSNNCKEALKFACNLAKDSKKVGNNESPRIIPVIMNGLNLTLAPTQNIYKWLFGIEQIQYSGRSFWYALAPPREFKMLIDEVMKTPLPAKRSEELSFLEKINLFFYRHLRIIQSLIFNPRLPR